MLTTVKTQLQLDIEATDNDVLGVGQALHSAVGTMLKGYKRFWTRPADQILAEINADLPKTLAIMSANTATGNALNAQLDIINDARFPRRAITVLPAEWSFDSTTYVFTYTAPPVVVPDPPVVVEPELPE